MSPRASANTLYNILTFVCADLQRHSTIRPAEKTINVVSGRHKILKTSRRSQCSTNTAIPFCDPNINLIESLNSMFQSGTELITLSFIRKFPKNFYCFVCAQSINAITLVCVKATCIIEDKYFY